MQLTFLGASTSETASSLDQEKYLTTLVAATPQSVLRTGQGSAWGMSDSSLSINSLLLAAEDNPLTPETSRRANPFNKPVGTIG